MDSTTIVLLILFFFSLLLIAIGLMTRWTGGLFLSRLPKGFLKDSYEPKFDSERQTGMYVSNILLKYIPPITFVLLIILFFKLFRIK